MAKLRIADLFLYRARYAIGYGLIGVLLISSLVFAGLLVPGGLTEHEQASVVVSSSLDFNHLANLAILDLPYHLLQLLSIELFGVTALSVKLPSLILGLLAAVGLIFLLRQWFRYNVAVIAAIIAITTSQFLFVAQNGTPMIMHLFWPIWLMLSATMIARQAKPVLLWRFLFFVLAALSLYTPLSIYVLIAISTAVILHPHLRYLFWRVPAGDIAFSASVASLLLIPLGYQLFTQPEFGLTLLGLSTSQPDILAGLQVIATQMFDFTGSSVAASGMMLPLFSLGSLLIIALGLVGVFRALHSVKTYLIVLWLLLLLPALVNEPGYLVITFVPLVLLLAGGLNMLFYYWYGLFPKNPYARVAGLLPLAVLVGGLMASGIDRYVYGYTYSGNVVNQFSNDITLLNNELAGSNTSTALVVGADQSKFYSAFAERARGSVTASSTLPEELPDRVIIAGGEHTTAPQGKVLDKIITNGLKENSARFYVYKNPRT